MTAYIVFLIVLALVFDFLNGFHDSANSIATIVSTRVLSPKYAVVWAAFFNFVAFLFLGLHVANTIGKGIIDVNIIGPHVILATLVGACAWDIITWFFGLPTSSSHALIGGMVGAALVKAGPDALMAAGIIKTVLFIFISPTVGLILGLGIGTAVYWMFRKATPLHVDHIFRKGQLVSAALYSLGHGGNDAQKTMASSPASSSAPACWATRSTCLSGWSYPARRPSPWAPCSGAGGSSRPWARRSPSSGPWTDSAQRRGRP